MAGSPLLSLVDANGDPLNLERESGAVESGAAAIGTPPTPQSAQSGRQGAPERQAAPERAGTIRPPAYSDEIMRVINLHEFEDAAKRSLPIAAYDYVAAGAGDELTLRANYEAYDRYWVRRKVMVDVSRVDTSVDLLGHRLEHPVLLGPAGAKNIMRANGDRLTAQAAHHSKALLVGGQPNAMVEMGKAGGAPLWWAANLGNPDETSAVTFAKRSEDAGAAALCVTVDYPYTGARDRPSRHYWDPEWGRTGVYGTPETRAGFQAGMLDPYNPNLTWDWMKWVRPATKLPIVIKGILTAEDARLAVETGAQAIVVSNHGARTLDGGGGTLDILPEVVDAVGGRIPVLVDGGIRRGGDIIKALALGARAILIGRPYLWGLAAFGQDGVQRVIELLHGELRVALGLSGAGHLGALDRSFIRRAWKPYDRSAPRGSAVRQ